jgi:hypothetical protein
MGFLSNLLHKLKRPAGVPVTKAPAPAADPRAHEPDQPQPTQGPPPEGGAS